MNIPLPTISPREIPSVCHMLRTKNAFQAFGDENPNYTPWELGESTTAVYWCLKTMDCAGPDDDFAHPSICQSGRGCYRPAGE